MTEGWPSSISSFDDIFQRFFGSGMMSQPPVQRTGLGRLMTDNAKLLIATARETARDWGNHEVTPENLLYAATEAEPGRSIIAELGHDPDKVANQMRDVSDTGEPAEEADEPVTLSPAAKLALRAAQRRAAEAGSSYIGPEHVLLGIASLTDSPAAHVLLSGAKPAPTGRPAKSETPTLDEYSRDPTAEARAVINTSNIGSDLILSAPEGDVDAITPQLMDRLSAHFRPEFLNRIDETIVFHRLDRQELRNIVDLVLDGTRRLLHAQDIDLDITDPAVDWLAEHGYQPEYGARPLRRTVQKELDNKLSRLLLDGKLGPGDAVRVDADDSGLILGAIAHRGGQTVEAGV